MLAAAARLVTGDGRIVSATALAQAAARVAAALPDPTPGSCIAFAFDRDRFAFAAALLGTWLRGHTAALPTSARLRHVGPVLARPEVAVLAHDTGAGTGLDVPKLLASDGALASEAPAVALAGPIATYREGEDGAFVAEGQDQATLARAITAAIDALHLPPAAVLANAFTPGFPLALVPGLLAPLAAGASVCEAATAGARLDTLVAPGAFVRGNPGLAAHVVRIDRPADPRAVQLADALLAAGARDAAVAIAGERAFAAIAGAMPDTALIARLGHGVGLSLAVTARDRLPRDDDGQLDDAVVLRLHHRQTDGTEPNEHAAIEPLGDIGDRAQFRITLPRDFFAFAGHFPTYAVLSGVAQLHELVLPCLRRLAGAHAAVAASAFTDLKFLARIAPGDEVVLAVRWPVGSEVAEFEITRDSVHGARGERCSIGRVTVRAPRQAGGA